MVQASAISCAAWRANYFGAIPLGGARPDVVNPRRID
jgi:hypothetical protein